MKDLKINTNEQCLMSMKNIFQRKQWFNFFSVLFLEWKADAGECMDSIWDGPEKNSTHDLCVLRPRKFDLPGVSRFSVSQISTVDFHGCFSTFLNDHININSLLFPSNSAGNCKKKKN